MTKIDKNNIKRIYNYSLRSIEQMTLVHGESFTMQD